MMRAKACELGPEKDTPGINANTELRSADTRLKHPPSKYRLSNRLISLSISEWGKVRSPRAPQPGGCPAGLLSMNMLRYPTIAIRMYMTVFGIMSIPIAGMRWTRRMTGV